MLQTAPSPSPALFTLLPNALELLDYDTENLRKLLKIIDSYIILDPQSTLQPGNTAVLFAKLADKVLHSREQAGTYITHTLDLAFQSVPLPLYGDNLVQSGLLCNVLSLLIQDQVLFYFSLWTIID